MTFGERIEKNLSAIARQREIDQRRFERNRLTAGERHSQSKERRREQAWNARARDYRRIEPCDHVLHGYVSTLHPLLWEGRENYPVPIRVHFTSEFM